VVRLHDTPERIVLAADAAEPGLVVLRDTFFPGWQALVDGRPAPLLRADFLFRAVPVPAGRHTVELRYRSRALERGLLVSIVSLLATIGLAFVPIRRPPSRPPAAG
jgi:uncharacterized membrane protein YfhO